MFISSLTETQVAIIRITMIIGSIVSLSSTLFVFFIYWFFKENRTFIFELTMWFSCSVATYSISCLLPYNRTNELLWCPVQSFLSNSALLSQEIWCSILAYCGLIAMVRSNYFNSAERCYRMAFCSIAICLPLILSLLIILFKVYGDSDGFCWIDIYSEKDNKPLVFEMVLLFFSIDWFIIIINLYFIIKIVMLSKAQPHLKNPVYSYIIWYPIVNSCFKLIAVGNRLMTLMKLEHNSFAFSQIQTIVDSFEGCIFMIIFLLAPKFRVLVQTLWKNLCKRKRSLRVDNSILSEQSNERHDLIEPKDALSI